MGNGGRDETTAQWECRVCLYLHEGGKPPDKCPVCGAPASEFLPADE
jgi:Na+-transporting NADH:ubiquinone oxidoreductase subunit C